METRQNNKNQMCKIVVVDDVKKVRFDLKTKLQDLFPEHTVYAYASTSKALEKVKELNFIDIVVFNSLKDKKPDGIDFANTLRNKFPSTMLIYINHQEKPNYDQLCMLAEFGIDNYLLKPYTTEALKFIVINSLNRIKSLQIYKSEEHDALEDAVDNFIRSFNSTVNKELNKRPKHGLLSKIMGVDNDRKKRRKN